MSTEDVFLKCWLVILLLSFFKGVPSSIMTGYLQISEYRTLFMAYNNALKTFLMSFIISNDP